MIITIPPWHILEAEFGLDEDDDIGNDDEFFWTRDAESYMASRPTREVEIADTPDSDGDYSLITYIPGIVTHILQDMYAFIISQSFGTHRTLGKPSALIKPF